MTRRTIIYSDRIEVIDETNQTDFEKILRDDIDDIQKEIEQHLDACAGPYDLAKLYGIKEGLERAIVLLSL